MMRRPDAGAIAPQLLILLFFLSALGLGAALVLSSLFSLTARAQARDAEREALYALVLSLMEVMESDPTPQWDVREDPIWEYNGISKDGMEIKIRTLSDALNPNFVRKNILSETALANLFKPGKTAEELQQFREDEGLSPFREAYRDFFEEQVLDRYFSGYGWANINLIDEFAARSLARSLHGGAHSSETKAESLRSIIQSLLMVQKVVEKTELHALIISDFEVLFPFLNAEPSMNVNFVEPLILRELLAYPAYGVEDPEAKSQELLFLRNSGGVNPSLLNSLLGLVPPHRLLHYFGTTSWFWSLELKGKTLSCTAVICRLPHEVSGVEEENRYRLLELRYGI